MDHPRVFVKHFFLVCVLLALTFFLRADSAHLNPRFSNDAPTPLPESTIGEPTPSPSPTPEPLAGDVDVDYAITAADAAKLLRFANGTEGLAYTVLKNADLTQNGDIDETDAKVALWLSANKIPDTDAFVETIRTGLCDEKDFDRFEYDGTDDDGVGNYRSANVSISMKTLRAYDSVAFVADIYIRDLSSLYTVIAPSSDRDEPIGRQSIREMVTESGGILGTNGDYCTHRTGPLARNGEWLSTYRSAYTDICVLNYDGTMETYLAQAYRCGDVAETPRYQVWGFGPSLLLEDGTARTKFKNYVLPKNPRTVIGCYEVGHYCLIAVDGRDKSYSAGMQMSDLAAFCASLDLALAFNLDGGMTTVMATREAVVNAPTRGGRLCNDAIVIGEPNPERPASGS